MFSSISITVDANSTRSNVYLARSDNLGYEILLVQYNDLLIGTSKRVSAGRSSKIEDNSKSLLEGVD